MIRFLFWGQSELGALSRRHNDAGRFQIESDAFNATFDRAFGLDTYPFTITLDPQGAVRQYSFDLGRPGFRRTIRTSSAMAARTSARTTRRRVSKPIWACLSVYEERMGTTYTGIAAPSNFPLCLF